MIDYKQHYKLRIDSKKKVIPIDPMYLQEVLTNNCNTISKNLNKMRVEMDINIKDFAKLCGVSMSTIVQIGNHRYYETTPNLKAISSIATALGIHISDLLKED